MDGKERKRKQDRTSPESRRGKRMGRIGRQIVSQRGGMTGEAN